jgi:MFS family permease
MTKATAGQRVLLVALLTVALMAPPVLLGISAQQGLASAFVYGGVIAIGAAFLDLRLAVVLAAVSGGAGVVAALLNPFPLAGAIFFGLFTGTCALAAKRGLHSPVLMAPIFISFVLVAPPQVSGMSGTAAAVVTGAVILLGGLWTTLSVRILIGWPRTREPREGLSGRATLMYAITMGVVLGVAAWVVLNHAKYHEGAWLLLTLIVVLQPSPGDTLTRSVQRLAGTLVGSGVALLLIVFGVQSTLAVMVAGVMFFAAFTVRYAWKRPYWQYVSLLTPAVILMDTPGRDGLRVTEDRVGFTFIAVIVALGLAVAIKALLIWRAHEGRST